MHRVHPVSIDLGGSVKGTGSRLEVVPFVHTFLSFGTELLRHVVDQLEGKCILHVDLVLC
uniref:Uncharacterized protein n=1 Tax=Lepeophtheirus salmonis TaxID=72036 RepID=A0A0K2TQE8_LEPSM